jgi:2-oxoglutarate ferredoxin oxidoreductase subunit alpha
MTTGNTLFDAAAKVGWYGILSRTVGPQIRGGEAAAMLRLSAEPSSGPDDFFDVLLAIDWKNVERFAREIPLNADSLIICDIKAGDVPEEIARSGARIIQLPITATARKVKKGRPNMVALGILAKIVDVPEATVASLLESKLANKGEQAVQSSLETVVLGRELAADLPTLARFNGVAPAAGERWVISGNEAAGLGAIRGGVRFVAAYPITPATEVLEWLAPQLPRVGGTLVQAEDELSSINMLIGGSFGGVPSLTSTSGPGLALMTESLGLAVAAEVPLVVVDVMRGGPSTGIPTKPEQSDLNIAVYGLHGDAPHLVLAPLSVEDCIFTTQWSVHLAEALQTPAIVLSDQFLGQARAVINKPADLAFIAQRKLARQPDEDFARYAVTADGVSPMSIPGTPGGQYVADGLAHSPVGLPSTQADHHSEQMDKRLRKLTEFNYGDHWADIEGDGELAVISWGLAATASREAVRRLREQGKAVKLIAVRLISPIQPEKMAQVLEGVKRVLVIELNHSGQFYHYLKGHYELSAEVQAFNRPSPLVIRPGEIMDKIEAWSRA